MAMMSVWSCSMKVLFAVLVGSQAAVVTVREKDPSLPQCNDEQVGRLSTEGKKCTIECYPYEKGLKQIRERLADGRDCDSDKSVKWGVIEADLIKQYTCRSTAEGKPDMLCVEAGLAVALTNYVGAECMPNWDANTMWMDPSTAGLDVLGCAKKTVKPPTLAAGGDGSLGAKKPDASESTRFNLECVPKAVQSSCSGHVWRSPVAVNGKCVAVCSSHFCSSDFSFNYCLRLTTMHGLTNKQCTADTIVRTRCFT